MVKDTNFVNICFALMKRQANKMLVLNEVIIIYSNVCLLCRAPCNTNILFCLAYFIEKEEDNFWHLEMMVRYIVL